MVKLWSSCTSESRTRLFLALDLHCATAALEAGDVLQLLKEFSWLSRFYFFIKTKKDTDVDKRLLASRRVRETKQACCTVTVLCNLNNVCHTTAKFQRLPNYPSNKSLIAQSAVGPNLCVGRQTRARLLANS